MNTLIPKLRLSNLPFWGLAVVIIMFMLAGTIYKIHYSFLHHKNLKQMILVPGGQHFVGCPPDPILEYLRQSSSSEERLSPSFLQSLIESQASQMVLLTNDYYIDLHEVTNNEYLYFSSYFYHFPEVLPMFSHPSAPFKADLQPSTIRDGELNSLKQPVTGIDIWDAYAYASFVGKRLPSLEEWEYICSNRGKTRYPWGNAFISENVIMDNIKHPFPEMRESFKQGKSLDYGLYNLSGNVAEWTSPYRIEDDWYAYAKGGGCFDKPKEVYSMCTFSTPFPAGFKDNDIGMRLVSDTLNRSSRLTLVDFEDFYYNLDPKTPLDTVYFAYNNYHYFLNRIDSIRSEQVFIGRGLYTIDEDIQKSKLLTIAESGQSVNAINKFIQYPLKSVEIKGFYIDPTEVTIEAYSKFLADPLVKYKWYAHPKEPSNNTYTPEFWEIDEYKHKDQPVVGIDWWDAYAYAKWAGKRLPTQEEWEIAARYFEQVGDSVHQVDEYLYPWGNEYQPGITYTLEEQGTFPTLVTSYNKDKTPTGIQGMGGNVSEWTSSIETHNNVQYYAIKGGNFQRKGEIYSLSFLNERATPNMRHETLGFRCVVDQ